METWASSTYPLSSTLFRPKTDTPAARLILNLKGIPYKTEWIEYPDLAPTFKAYGIPPNAKPPEYTSPVIKIGDKYVMDSQNIAIELENQYPSPSLHLDSPPLPKVHKLIGEAVLEHLGGVLMPKVPGSVLSQGSVDYWVSKQEASFGMSLSQIEKELGREAAWEKATPLLKELGILLKAEGGPFVMGETGECVIA